MDSKLNIAIYPGSFDPITNGHLDIIDRSSKLFDKLIVSISKKTINKKCLFNDQERLALIEDNISHLSNVEVLVFDEVDSGVSGSVADAIAVRLLNLSKTQQVLVVTHLPQVAAKGDQHYRTSKYLQNNLTITEVKELNNKDRIDEIASMISGKQLTDEAKELSKKLLNN